jgi:hypothetical protein
VFGTANPTTGVISTARFLARWHQRPQRLEREQGADQGHNRGVDRVPSGTLSLYFKWTDASRCHRSAQTGGFPAATFAGTCKAMIAQRRGRVSFCSAGRTCSPGEDHCFTLSAQDHSLFNRSVLSVQVINFPVSIFQEFRLTRCGRTWHMVGVLGAQCVGSRWQWVA